MINKRVLYVYQKASQVMRRFLFEYICAKAILMRVMNMKLLAGLFVVMLFINARGHAQAVPDTSLNRVITDTAPPRNAPVRPSPGPDQTTYDSLKGKQLLFQPVPKKSALYSAILPGAGQLYNRQYWKIPVIYAGIAASTYFLIDNSREYQRYRRAYIARINNPAYQDEFTKLGRTPADLQFLQNLYKKQLDLTVLLSTIGYTLQVLDALTFAHLKNFDVSRDISMKMQPVAMPNGDPGFGLVMRF